MTHSQLSYQRDHKQSIDLRRQGTYGEHKRKDLCSVYLDTVVQCFFCGLSTGYGMEICEILNLVV